MEQLEAMVLEALMAKTVKLVLLEKEDKMEQLV
jgi:hypothetical protein